jgi:hypothetical protein
MERKPDQLILQASRLRVHDEDQSVPGGKACRVTRAAG